MPFDVEMCRHCPGVALADCEYHSSKARAAAVKEDKDTFVMKVFPSISLLAVKKWKIRWTAIPGNPVHRPGDTGWFGGLGPGAITYPAKELAEDRVEELRRSFGHVFSYTLEEVPA